MAGSGRRVLVYNERQAALAAAEGEDGPFPAYLPDGSAAVYPAPIREPRKAEPEPPKETGSRNELNIPPQTVENRMFKRGRGRPPGSKNKPK